MKRFMLLIGLMPLLLSGCIAAVVAGAAAGLIVYDKRTVGTLESDTRIFHLIHKSIVKNPRFRDSRIVVVSFNKVVLLIGQTPLSDLRIVAEKIAQNTPQVRRVYNELTLGQPIALSARSQDTLLTTEIRTKMLGKKGLESGSIRVVTENGNVYLMGIVTHEQADIAVQVARQVNEVKRVVKIFQYIT